MRADLRAEPAEAEERVREGWSSVGKGATGLSFNKLAPGHEVLVRNRDTCRRMLDWADKNVTFQPRPLEAFGDSENEDNELRTQLGASANDALELAKHTGNPLYADDLGLRRLAKDKGVASYSTTSQLQVLTEAGKMAGPERDGHFVSLAEGSLHQCAHVTRVTNRGSEAGNWTRDPDGFQSTGRAFYDPSRRGARHRPSNEARCLRGRPDNGFEPGDSTRPCGNVPSMARAGLRPSHRQSCG